MERIMMDGWMDEWKEGKKESVKEGKKGKEKKGIEINKANPPGPVQYGNGFNPPEVSHTLTVSARNFHSWPNSVCLP